jgi:hypothetical protein
MTIKAETADYLRERMKDTDGLKDIRVVTSRRALGDVRSPVLIVTTQSYEKLPVAPKLIQGNLMLTLVSPHQDVDKAEEDLESRFETLSAALLAWSLFWTNATNVAYDEQRMALDITLTSTFKKE